MFDVLSGFDSDMGWIVGVGVVVVVIYMFIFIGVKFGFYMGDGCDFVGEIYVVLFDVVLFVVLVIVLNVFVWFVVVLFVCVFVFYKGMYGSFVVFGGDMGMCGVLIFVVCVVLFVGVGKVYVGFFGVGVLLYDLLFFELMLYLVDMFDFGVMIVIVVGCGFGMCEVVVMFVCDVFVYDFLMLFDVDVLNFVVMYVDFVVVVVVCGVCGKLCVLMLYLFEVVCLYGSDMVVV